MDKHARIKKFLINIGAISFLILGLYELILTRNTDGFSVKLLPKILATFGSVWLLAALYIWWKKPIKLLNLVLMFTTFNFFYLLLELYVYMNINYNFKNQYFLINKPFTDYHESRGYYYTGPVHIANIIKGQLEFDVEVKPNNFGYSSHRDYSYKKQDSTTYRIMVLGDSFSDACFLDQPWADKLQDVLKQNGKNIEVYNFSYSGNGLINWYQILNKEILPKYEFDCIVIANFTDDLSRKFNIQYLKDKYLIGNFDTIPNSVEDFKANYEPRMKDYTTIKGYSHEIISDPGAFDIRKKELLAQSKLVDTEGHLKKPEPYILNFLFNDIIGAIRYRNMQNPTITYEQVQAKFGEDRIKLLASIVDTCKQLNKRVVLASIPAKLSALVHKKDANNQHQQECKLLSDKMKIDYFDGYDIFLDIPEKNRKDYWLINDGHWNSKGSDLFGEKISQLFLK
jgi:hypothetical protein